MVALGRPWGRQVRYLVSSMAQPLGRMVGNALEVKGASETLRGGGPHDLRELATHLAGRLAEAAGVVPEGDGPARAGAALDDGVGPGRGRAVDRGAGRRPGRLDAPAVPAGGAAGAARARARPTGTCTASTPARSGRRRAGSAPGACTRTRRSTWPSGWSCGPRWATRPCAGEPLALVHARDPSLGERSVGMVAEAYAIAAGRRPAPRWCSPRADARCRSSPRSRRSAASSPSGCPAARCARVEVRDPLLVSPEAPARVRRRAGRAAPRAGGPPGQVPGGRPRLGGLPGDAPAHDRPALVERRRAATRALRHVRARASTSTTAARWSSRTRAASAAPGCCRPAPDRAATGRRGPASSRSRARSRPAGWATSWPAGARRSSRCS